MQYTEEQHDWLLKHWNNPYDGSMLATVFNTKFNERMEWEKSKHHFRENAKQFGTLDIKQYIRHVDEKWEHLPRIRPCQMYIMEPHLMRNGNMSKPHIVYISHVGNTDSDDDDDSDGEDEEDEDYEEPSYYPEDGIDFQQVCDSFISLKST